MKKHIFLFMFIMLFLRFPVFSDNREENIDVFIVLDKSLSMEDKIGAVSGYINTYIVDRIIIPGDMLYILDFYGKTEILINSEITDENHKTEIKNTIKEVKADGRFTDIGNALDGLSEIIPRYENNGRLKYMLLITDGKQEAPPESIYYSPDGSFNHRFLEHTRTIEKQGWKIQVLGIGNNTDAKAIAEKLSAAYSEVEAPADSSDEASEKLIKDMISETEDFLTVFSITSPPEIIYKGFFQKSFMVITIETSNLETEKLVKLSSMYLKTDTLSETDILETRKSIEFTENGIREVQIPVIIPSALEPGKVNGSLRIYYNSHDNLTPSILDITFKNKGILSRFFLHFSAVGILLIFLLFLLLKKRSTPVLSVKKEGSGKEIAFYCYVDGSKLQELPFILGNQDKLYLNLSPAGFINFTKQKLATTKAFLTAKGNMISMEVIDKSFIEGPKNVFDNILEKSFNFMKKNGKHLLINFKRK